MPNQEMVQREKLSFQLGGAYLLLARAVWIVVAVVVLWLSPLAASLTCTVQESMQSEQVAVCLRENTE